MEEDAGAEVGPRVHRRDAARNRERLIASALSMIARDGFNVPVLTIAQEAGLGVATFYRSFPDRSALMRELEHRAYDSLVAILESSRADGVHGLEAVERFLIDSLGIADQLILPLHGAAPFMDDDAIHKRITIDNMLEVFLSEGRVDGSIRHDANATDIIVCSALITQPLHFTSHWQTSARRHIALFLAGLAAGANLPGPAVEQSDIEASLRLEAERTLSPGSGND